MRRRRRRRGLIIATSVILAPIVVTGGYVAWALTAPVPAPVVTYQTPQAAPEGRTPLAV